MRFYVGAQESVEDMGLYKDVSGAGGASAQVTVASLLYVIYEIVGILTGAPLCFVYIGVYMCMLVAHRDTFFRMPWLSLFYSVFIGRHILLRSQVQQELFFEKIRTL